MKGLTDQHILILRIMCVIVQRTNNVIHHDVLHRRKRKFTYIPIEAINNIAFACMMEKEYVRSLLHDLKEIDLIENVSFGKGKKWRLTKKGYNEGVKQFNEWYKTIKK